VGFGVEYFFFIPLLILIPISASAITYSNVTFVTDDSTLNVTGSNSIEINKLRIESDGISMRKIAWEEFRKIDFNRTASAVTYNFEILQINEDDWIFNRTTAGIADAFGELTSTEPGDIHLDGATIIPLNYNAFLTSIDINSNLTVRIIYTPVFTPANFTSPNLSVNPSPISIDARLE